MVFILLFKKSIVNLHDLYPYIRVRCSTSQFNEIINNKNYIKL